jgi:hypothetical protein
MLQESFNDVSVRCPCCTESSDGLWQALSMLLPPQFFKAAGRFAEIGFNLGSDAVHHWPPVSWRAVVRYLVIRRISSTTC